MHEPMRHYQDASHQKVTLGYFQNQLLPLRLEVQRSQDIHARLVQMHIPSNPQYLVGLCETEQGLGGRRLVLGYIAQGQTARYLVLV